MTDIPEDVMEAAYQVIARHRALDGSELKRGGAMATFIARAIHAERERTAARLDRVESLLKRAGEALAFCRDGFKPTPNKKYGGLEYKPTEALLDDCGNVAMAAATEIEEALNDRS